MGSPLEEALERYLAARSSQLLPSTIQHYRHFVTSLIEFLHLHYPEVDTFSKLQRSPHVEGWLQMLQRREPPHTKGTLSAFIFSVRRFLRDIQKWGWPGSPPSPSPRLFLGRDLPRRPYYAQGNKNPNVPRRERAAPLDDSLLNSPLNKALNRYLDIRSATLRPMSLSHYRGAVLSLIRFLGKHFPEIDSFKEIERNPHMEGWLEALAKAQPPLKNETRQDRIRSVSRFFADLCEWGWSESPPEGLILRGDFPPGQHHLPKPLPPDTDAVLMEELKKEGDDVSLGLVLARRTGLRVGELCRLELDCLMEDPQDRYSLQVPLGKLRTERVIPIDRETAELIKTLRTMRGEQPPTVDPETGKAVEFLFFRENGPIRPSVFARKLSSVAKSSGITLRVFPHRLRHTYATELLRCGVSLLGVMKLLGHKSLKMTLRYVEVTNEDLGRDYLKAMEKARDRYSKLEVPKIGKAKGDQEPLEILQATFDELVARVQALRFDQPAPGRRKELRRFVERLRRAQSELPDLLH